MVTHVLLSSHSLHSCCSTTPFTAMLTLIPTFKKKKKKEEIFLKIAIVKRTFIKLYSPPQFPHLEIHCSLQIRCQFWRHWSIGFNAGYLHCLTLPVSLLLHPSQHNYAKTWCQPSHWQSFSPSITLLLGTLLVSAQWGEQAWRKYGQSCKQPISSRFTNHRPRSIIFSIFCPCSCPAVPQIIFHFSEQVELLVAVTVTAGWLVHLKLQIRKLEFFY